jgi:hypothetical protein
MYSYTISGLPATKVRAPSRSKQIWDEISNQQFHAAHQLAEQLGATPKHVGLVEVRFIFYLPFPLSMSRRLEHNKDIYHESKPRLHYMVYFAEQMLLGHLLDKGAIVVSQSAKKVYSAVPLTRIEIIPVVNK